MLPDNEYTKATTSKPAACKSISIEIVLFILMLINGDQCWSIPHNTLKELIRIERYFGIGQFKDVLYIKAWKVDFFTSSALPLQP